MLKFTTKTTGPEQTRTFTGSLCHPKTHFDRRATPADHVKDGLALRCYAAGRLADLALVCGTTAFLLVDDECICPSCVALVDLVLLEVCDAD